MNSLETKFRLLPVMQLNCLLDALLSRAMLWSLKIDFEVFMDLIGPAKPSSELVMFLYWFVSFPQFS